MTESTSPESPSALLERAAEAIELLAEQASPAPWVIGLFGHLVRDASGEAVASNIGNEADDRWIKTMSPAVASPLVEWLRDTAADLRAEHEQVETSSTEYALAFARHILGEPG